MRRLAETAVLVAVALAMIATWLAEPLEVVSGSMSPTLLGPHRDFECAHCGTRNFLPADLRPMIGRPAYCESCRQPGPIEAELPIARGDRVLVDRTAFLRREPRRWDVVAFRLPHQARKLAVKRILGLPGETIKFRGGAWYADDKQLEPPPPIADDLPKQPAANGATASGPPANGPAGPPAGDEAAAGILSQWKLSESEYFMIGDDSRLSDDSRTWRSGPGVSAQLIIGQPVIVHLPARSASLFGRSIHVPDLARVRYIR
jgi:signal peptidase I